MTSNLRKKIGEALFGHRVRDLTDSMEDFLLKRSHIIDLGAGTCLFTKLLRSRGFRVTPVDVKNRSYFPSITPTIYDGETLPFPDDAFDACILIAVLHHTISPARVLAEAARVSKRIVVYEDLITNPVQTVLTYLIDSVLNKEFAGHPHTNKTDPQWHALFRKLSLTVKKKTYETTWGFLKNGMYFLERDA